MKKHKKRSKAQKLGLSNREYKLYRNNLVQISIIDKEKSNKNKPRTVDTSFWDGKTIKIVGFLGSLASIAGIFFIFFPSQKEQQNRNNDLSPKDSSAKYFEYDTIVHTVVKIEEEMIKKEKSIDNSGDIFNNIKNAESKEYLDSELNKFRDYIDNYGKEQIDIKSLGGKVITDSILSVK